MNTLIITIVGIFIAGMVFDFIYGLVQLWDECQAKMPKTSQVRVEDIFKVLEEDEDEEDFWQLPIDEPVAVKWDTASIPF